jgi:hypothetical protein
MESVEFVVRSQKVTSLARFLLANTTWAEVILGSKFVENWFPIDLHVFFFSATKHTIELKFEL